MRGKYQDRLYALPARTRWADQHVRTITEGDNALAAMIGGWLAYADQYRLQFGGNIGDDGVLGDPWADVGKNLLRLLNGDLGGMDGGTLDRVIRRTLHDEGYEAD